MPGAVVFTDLDATLLDHRTYAFDVARPALELLRRLGVPVVPVTSKTAAETIEVRGRLGLDGPFAVENGGGVYLPEGLAPGGVARGAYRLHALGEGAGALRAGMALLRGRTGGAVRTFADLGVLGVARETGLAPEAAARAMQREFDEPFLLAERAEELAPRLAGFAAEAGLRVSKGGRFWHLHGAGDKGRAVRFVLDVLSAGGPRPRSVGIGDSANDGPMLLAVDAPWAVLRPDGTLSPELAASVPGLRRADRPGPEGWNAAMFAEFSVGR